MLDTLFMQILDMTKVASVVIAVVLLVRLLLRRAPKIFSYALWAVVLFRLLCPVSIEAPVSVVPEMEPIAESYTLAEQPISFQGASQAAQQAVGDALNGGLGVQHVYTTTPNERGGTEVVSTTWWEVWVLFGQYLWLLGVGAMAVYGAVTYLLLRRRLIGVMRLRDNIYLADGIDSPFVMGIVRPRVYLPSSLPEREQGYILLHEQHHIRRGDHLIKLLAFLALSIHWFNPLVWLAFVLSSKDMEMSCDEAVVKKLGEGIRADYSASLLSLATGRRVIGGAPLAFGEGDTRGRIKNLVNWKKPAVWIVALATVACAVVMAVCGTNAAGGSWIRLEKASTETGAPRYTWKLEQPIQSWAIYEDVYSNGRLISSDARITDGFVDSGGASGRHDSFSLEVMPAFAAGEDGFTGELKVVYEGAGTIEWTLVLPGSRYSASAGHNHLLREPPDIRNRFELENNGEIVLYSQLFSTAEDGGIYVDDLQNDAVVQYRLVTSTAPVQEFSRRDHALELYELRIPVLQSPEDARPLTELLGVDEWGTYTLDRWSDANDTALLIAFENAPEDEDALMRQMHPVVYLLTALIGDIDGVHYSFPRGGEQQELITVYDTHDADRYAEAIGFQDLKTAACSPVGIRMLLEYLGWTGGSAESEPTGNYGTAQDVSYYLELAAGETFQDMGLEKRVSLLVEYEDLLDDYSLIARETEDGKTAYIVGQYNGNPTVSPLYGMYGVEVPSADGEDLIQFLYREEESETVNAVLEANKTEFPPSAGYSLEQSSIIWREDSGVVLILPRGNKLPLNVAWNRYLYTPNGREYIADAVSRGIDVCGRTDTFLYFYLISERFGEIAERIPLTEQEAAAILAEKRVTLPEGHGFSATLHMDGQTTYFNEREGVPRSVLDIAVERCGYQFASPADIAGDIVEATLDCDWLDTTLRADKADLPRLKQILTNAEHGYMGACGYGARLKLTLADGRQLTLFKGTDDCDTMAFGSYGGYFIGDGANTEFWEMFGLDPATKSRVESNPAGAETVTVFSHEDLRLEVSGVQSVRQETMLDDGGKPHEYSVYTCYPGAAITVKNSGMLDGAYFEDGQAHAAWGLSYTNERERTRITEETKVVPITAELEGVYHLESSMFILKFEVGDPEITTEDLFFLQTGMRETDAQKFYAVFMNLIEADAKEAVLEKIHYPVSVTVDDGVFIANNAAELLPYYDDIFTDGLWKRIQEGRLSEGQADLFTNDGLIGAANGAIWFAEPHGVMTIQNPEGRSIRPPVSGITTEGGPSVPPTEEELHHAIMANFATVMSTYGNGSAVNADFRAEAHRHLATEQADMETYTFYSDVQYAAYVYHDGKYAAVDRVSVPTVLTYIWKDGAWKLDEFWTPGSTTSVANVFPPEAVEILNRAGQPGYYSELPARCDDQAIRNYVALHGTVPAKSFAPEDVNVLGQALTVGEDTMTYEERLAWIKAGPDMSGGSSFVALEQYREGEDCLAFLGQWVGTPHGGAYVFNLRFPDGSLAYLPLPDEGAFASALPDSMEFRNGKFLYEVMFPTEELTNEGQTLIHLKGTYRYEVELAEKTLSLTVVQ